MEAPDSKRSNSFGLTVGNRLGIYSNLFRVTEFGVQPVRADVAAAMLPNPLRQAQASRAEALLTALPDHRRIAVIENASLLGSAWTYLIPIYKSRELSDRQLSSAIANRLLISSETANHCRACNQPAAYQHGDVCEVRCHRPNKLRHDGARDILSRLAREKGAAVVLECAADGAAANPLLRSDIRITGAVAPDGIEGVVDISFTAPSSRNNIAAMAPLLRGAGVTARSWTKRQHGAFTCSFTPVVFSAGDYSTESNRAWLNRLGVFGTGKMATAFDLSVGLVRREPPLCNLAILIQRTISATNLLAFSGLFRSDVSLYRKAIFSKALAHSHLEYGLQLIFPSAEKRLIRPCAQSPLPLWLSEEVS